MDILGGASLNLDGADMSLTAHEIEGDDTGRVTLRKSQTYENTESRVLQTIGILSQRESSVNLPPELDCRGIDMYIKGKNSLFMKCFTLVMGSANIGRRRTFPSKGYGVFNIAVIFRRRCFSKLNTNKFGNVRSNVFVGGEGYRIHLN